MAELSAADFWREVRSEPLSAADAFSRLPDDLAATVAVAAVEELVTRARDRAFLAAQDDASRLFEQAKKIARACGTHDCWLGVWNGQLATGRVGAALVTAQELPDALRLKKLDELLATFVRTRADVLEISRPAPAPPDLGSILDAIVPLLQRGADRRTVERVLYALGLMGRAAEARRLMTLLDSLDGQSWLCVGLVVAGDIESLTELAEPHTPQREFRFTCLMVAELNAKVPEAARRVSDAGDFGRLALVRHHARCGNLDAAMEVADQIPERSTLRVRAEVTVAELAWAAERPDLCRARAEIGRRAVQATGVRSHLERLVQLAAQSSSDGTKGMRLTHDERVALAVARLRMRGLQAVLDTLRAERAGSRRVKVGYRVLRRAIDELGLHRFTELMKRTKAPTLVVLSLAARADAEDEVRDYETARELLELADEASASVRSKSERTELSELIRDLKSRLPPPRPQDDAA